jgi:hypothetical protein
MELLINDYIMWVVSPIVLSLLTFSMASASLEFSRKTKGANLFFLDRMRCEA